MLMCGVALSLSARSCVVVNCVVVESPGPGHTGHCPRGANSAHISHPAACRRHISRAERWRAAPARQRAESRDHVCGSGPRSCPPITAMMHAAWWPLATPLFNPFYSELTAITTVMTSPFFNLRQNVGQNCPQFWEFSCRTVRWGEGSYELDGAATASSQLRKYDCVPSEPRVTIWPCVSANINSFLVFCRAVIYHKATHRRPPPPRSDGSQDPSFGVGHWIATVEHCP